MPLYPTSFFLPPAGVPFILEDKYMRGGYRVLATLAERDAIAVAARKAGMIVRVTEDNTLYELVGGTGNAFWQPIDLMKYIKLGAPLILGGDGSITLDLGSSFNLTDGKLEINVTDLLGPTLKDFFSATSADDGKVLSYDGATGTFILKTVSSGTSGPSYSAADPITINGQNEIGINFTNLFSTSLVTFFSAAAGDDGKVLTYDHATQKFILKTPAAGGTTLERTSVVENRGSIAAGAASDFTVPTGKTAMIVALSVNVADVTVECHSTSTRTDVNPYKFKSATGKLSDDGTSILEDGSTQYNRRYAFVANLEATPGSNTYWRVTNNSASAQSITVNITYLTYE